MSRAACATPRLAARSDLHAVQQRTGVSLPSDVSSVGDRYERHADQVADAVVRGESAAPLLGQMAGGAREGAPVQQRGVVQREEASADVAGDTLALLALGGQLRQTHPTGIPLAVWSQTDDPADAEIVHRSRDWATAQSAVGAVELAAKADAISLGTAIPITEGQDLAEVVLTLMRTVDAAITAVEEQDNAEPVPASRRVRVLAIFSHATGSSLRIGSGVNHNNAAALIAALAPVLTDDVKVVTYGCSTSKGAQEELDEIDGNGKSQREFIMSDGGEGSINDTMAEALRDEGKADASVWGHSYLGPTTRNPALREFPVTGNVSAEQDADAPTGADVDAPGRAFAIDPRYVGTWKQDALDDLREIVFDAGYDPSPPNRRDRKTLAYRGGKLIEAEYFKLYHDLMRRRRADFHGHDTLAEAAPPFPVEVGQRIREAWQEHWIDCRNDVATTTIEEAELPRQ